MHSKLFLFFLHPGGGYSTEGLTGTCRWKFKNGPFVGLKFLEITYPTWDFLSKRYPENLKKRTLDGTFFQKRDPESLKTVPYVGLFEKNLTLSGTTDPKKGTLSSGTSPYQVLGEYPSGLVTQRNKEIFPIHNKSEAYHFSWNLI